MMAGELCGECGSPLAADQHYCLICGARVGARSAQLETLLQRLGEHSAAPQQARQQPQPQREAAPRTVWLRMPPPKIAALLVLGFLGFGVLLGGAAGSRVSDSLAASLTPLKLLIPAQSTGPTPTSSTAKTRESEVPPIEEQPTPTETPTQSTTSSTPAPAPAATTPAESEKPAATPQVAKKLPAIKHVFVVMLSEQPYAALFGPESQAHYLARTLEHRGSCSSATTRSRMRELANELALLSGQGPTAQTAENCPTYSDITPATPAADGQLSGSGCVYPASTPTLVGQLSAKHLSARAYVQGLDEGAGQPSACAHPRPASRPKRGGREWRLRELPQPVPLLPRAHRTAASCARADRWPWRPAQRPAR